MVMINSFRHNPEDPDLLCTLGLLYLQVGGTSQLGALVYVFVCLFVCGRVAQHRKPWTRWGAL